MNHMTPVSDGLLNAFVDGELDETERAWVLNRLASEPDLHLRISEMRLIKAMVRDALQQPTNHPDAADRQRPTASAPPRYRLAALTASLILLCGMAVGWLMRGEHDQTQFAALTRTIGTNDARVVIHLTASDPARLLAALDRVETLSAKHDADGRPAQVELLVNGGGLSLLRADTSPYAQRISALHAAHNNVSFVACNQTIENLRKSGEQVRLLPETEIAPSALDEIILRLSQGWKYVRV